MNYLRFIKSYSPDNNYSPDKIKSWLFPCNVANELSCCNLGNQSLKPINGRFSWLFQPARFRSALIGPFTLRLAGREMWLSADKRTGWGYCTQIVLWVPDWSPYNRTSTKRRCSVQDSHFSWSQMCTLSTMIAEGDRKLKCLCTLAANLQKRILSNIFHWKELETSHRPF